MAEQSNIFISHRHEDDALIDRLKKMLTKNGADIRDSSITRQTPNNAKSPDYIKNILADQIRWAGTIIVIISPDTKNHCWVNWEIEYARKFKNKRIIGVWAPGAAHANMPSGVKDYADALVAWNSHKIIDALKGQNIWTEPNGEQLPIQSIKRIHC